MNTKNIYQSIYTIKTGLLPLVLLLSVLVISCNQDVTGSADEAVTSAQITTLANLDNTQCLPGNFSENGVSPCTACPAGKYQNEAGQSFCIDAEPGRFVASEGAVQAALCPIGTFSSVSGAAACTDCAIGETTDGLGATACILITNDPATKDDCMNDGWEAFGFKNQGQCVRFVETGKDSR